MFCSLSGISFSRNTPVLGRFTSQKRINIHQTPFFLHTPDSSLSKERALKVLWEKSTSRSSKEPQCVTFLRVPRCGRHFQNWVTSSYNQIWLWPGLVKLVLAQIIRRPVNLRFDQSEFYNNKPAYLVTLLLSTKFVHQFPPFELNKLNRLS